MFSQVYVKNSVQGGVAGGHAWQGMCAWWGCVSQGGMHDREHVWLGEGHEWQGGAMRGRVGACMAGGGVCGRGHTWQERRPLQRTVRILLECILVKSMCSLL